MAIQTAGFQDASAAPVSNNLISFFAEFKPQISNIIFYNHHGILPMNVFKSLGLDREIAGETAQHFEAGWQHPNFHSATTVSSGGPGANLTVTVSSNDVMAATSAGTVYPRITDTILFKDGNGGSIVNKTNTAPGVWTVEISPYSSTATLSVTAGDALWIVGNSQPEFSTSPAPRDTGRALFQFPLQNVRETWQASGQALTTELWFTNDQFGNMRDTYTSGYLDAEYRWLEQVGNLATWGPLNTNASNADVNMYSMDYVVTTSGNDMDYVGGIYGINEVKENIRYANKLGSGTKMLFLEGPELTLSTTTGMSDVFSQNPNLFFEVATATEWNDKFVGDAAADAKAAGQEVNIDFKKIRYSEYHIYLCQVQQWGWETTGGADGFTQTAAGFWIPLQKAQDASGTLMDRFRLPYKRRDRWNRALQVWETGGQATTPTDTGDYLQINLLGEWGTEFFGAEHFQKINPAA